jgi:hypothetical protein
MFKELLFDVQGASLCRSFKDGEEVYMEVLECILEVLTNICSITIAPDHTWVKTNNKIVMERVKESVAMIRTICIFA